MVPRPLSSATSSPSCGGGPGFWPIFRASRKLEAFSASLFAGLVDLSISLWALLFVSTKRNHGHIRPNTSRQSPGNKEAAPNGQGATRDRGRDALAGSLGIESGETTRRQRESGVLLAKAVSRRQLGNNADTQLVAVKVGKDRSVEAAKDDIFFRDREPWRSSSQKGRFESLEP